MEQICMICCSTNPNDFLSDFDESLKPKIFQHFCKLFLSLKTFALSDDNLSLCSTCCSHLASVLSRKKDVVKVEKVVSSLQTSLLKELRSLQEQIEQLNSVLTKVKDCVAQSEPQSSLILGNPRRLRNKNDVILLREKVLNVTLDLNTFQFDLSSRLLHEEPSNPLFLKSEPEALIDFNDYPSDGNIYRGEPSTLSYSFQNLPKKRGSRKRKKSRKSEETLDFVDDFGSDYEPSDQDEAVSFEEDEDGRLEDSDSPSKTLKPSKKRKRKPRPSQNFSYLKSSIDSLPKLLESESEPSEFRKYAVEILMGQQVIVTLDNEAEGNEEVEKDADYYIEEFFKLKKTTIFEYLPDESGEKGKISLKGVEILINEEAQTLQCSLCSYQHNMEWPLAGGTSLENIKKNNVRAKLKRHIFQVHLNIFECPLCEVKKRYNSRTYPMHLRTHLNHHPLTCNICGMPCQHNYLLRKHLWSHKNEEEKFEALQNGEVDPRKPVNREPPQQCSTCGRQFKEKKHLKVHEQTHLKPEERIWVVCEVCGDSMPKTSLPTHRSQRCSLERVNCPVPECGKSFKNQFFMKRHFERIHSDNAKERPFVCHVCSRTFKVRPDLNFHLKTHQTDVLYKCEDCGKEFVMKRNLKRHACKNKKEAN